MPTDRPEKSGSAIIETGRNKSHVWGWYACPALRVMSLSDSLASAHLSSHFLFEVARTSSIFGRRMSTGPTNGDGSAQDQRTAIVPSRSGGPHASSPAEVQTKKRTGKTSPTHILQCVMAINRTSGSSPTCGGTKRPRVNTLAASNPQHELSGNTSTPSDTAQTICVPEASDSGLPSPYELTKPRGQGSTVPESNAQVQIPSTAVSAGFRPQSIAVKGALPPGAVKQSNAVSERQPLMPSLTRSEGTGTPRHLTSSTMTDSYKQKSAPKGVGYAIGPKMESQPAKSTQTCGETPDITTGPAQNEQRRSRKTRPSSDDDSDVEFITVREACPPTPDSSGEPLLELQTSLFQSHQSDSQLPQPIFSGTREPGNSDVAVIRLSQSTANGCRSPESHVEPQQHDRSTSTTWAGVESAKSGVSEGVVYEGSDMSDIDVRALGEQVKSAWAIGARRERLAKNMKELESKRREAYLNLRNSLALMDADIKEHVGLSTYLERLQSLVLRKEREVAAVVQRIDVGRGTANRIRREQRTCEDSIKRTEGELSSSGKQLQGILQALGLL